MFIDFAKVNWKKFCKWLKRRKDNQIANANIKREQAIGILRKRYGYTEEKAASELDEHYLKARLY